MSATAVPPSPVARVIGVPPAPVAAAAAPAARPAAGGLLQNRTALMVGGVVLVAGFALVSSMRGKGSTSAGNPQQVAVDTSQTDLYGDLQPELEQINKNLDLLNQGPRPPVPTPTPTPKPPGPPTPSPKPVPKTGWTYHKVAQGESFPYIAALYQTTTGRVFMSNIKGRKRADGSPGFMLSERDAKVGKVLVIPNAIKGNKA